MGKWQSQQQQHAFNEHNVVVYDIETIVDAEPADGSFPPWPQHRPVAAAFLTARWNPAGYDLRLDTVMCEPGDEAAFYEKVEQQLPASATGVTYNGRGFDNRVLAIRAMKHAPAFGLSGLARQVFAGRFEGAHCDLADPFGGWAEPGRWRWRTSVTRSTFRLRPAPPAAMSGRCGARATTARSAITSARTCSPPICAGCT